MSWLDNFAEGIFQIYSGNTLEAFQPIDFFHFYPIWYDNWIRKIDLAINILELDKKSYAEIKHLLPTPSSMRAIIQKLVPSFSAAKTTNPIAWVSVANFFARMLEQASPADPFALNSNPIHSFQELKDLNKVIS